MAIFKLFYGSIFFEYKNHASDSGFRHDINPLALEMDI